MSTKSFVITFLLTGLFCCAVPLAAHAAPIIGQTYTGPASTYGNDPVTGYADGEDNNIPALPGATNDLPGIAFLSWETLGGWWCVHSPDNVVALVRQTDYGPGEQSILVDINAVAARIVFHLGQGDYFPTHEGTWKITYLGDKGPSPTVSTLTKCYGIPQPVRPKITQQVPQLLFF